MGERQAGGEATGIVLIPSKSLPTPISIGAKREALEPDCRTSVIEESDWKKKDWK